MNKEGNEHFLYQIILNGASDDEIIQILKNRLPNTCNVESDDLFLRIEYTSNGNCEQIEEYNICKMIDIPVKCITYRSIKRNIDNCYKKVLYLTWECIAGAIV